MSFGAIIRAGTEQRSFVLPIKLKCIWSNKKKKKLKIARVWGCSIFWPPAPPHGMYLETDPPRFLYLNDEYFLMTDWCDVDISLIMKNSKSVTLTSRSLTRWGVGTEQRKILDQYLTSGIVSTRSIQRFKRYPILKTFNQNLQRKISMSVTLTSRLVRGCDGAALNFRPVPNIRQSINKIH